MGSDREATSLSPLDPPTERSLTRAAMLVLGGAHPMEIFPGISIDPDIRFGKPCIAGTRIDVATVVGALGGGDPFEEVERDYVLTREQVLAALSYAAHVAAHLPPAVRRAS